jgi:hypothetical protein
MNGGSVGQLPVIRAARLENVVASTTPTRERRFVNGFVN